MQNVIRNAILTTAAILAVMGACSIASCQYVAAGGVALTAQACLSPEVVEAADDQLEQDLGNAGAQYEAGELTLEQYQKAVADAIQLYGNTLGQNVVTSTVAALSEKLTEVAAQGAAGGGLLGGIATLGLNVWRNRTRRRDFVQTVGQEPPALKKNPHPKGPTPK